MKNILLYSLIFFSFFFSACATKSSSPDKLIRNSAERHMDKGKKAYHKGCFHIAADNYQAALERYTSIDKIEGTALALNNMANAYGKMHRYQDALLCYEEAYKRASIVKDEKLKKQSLANQAALLLKLGQGSEAKKLLELLKEDNSPLIIRSRAKLMQMEGRGEPALSLLEEALKNPENKENSSLYFCMGEIYLAESSAEKAYTSFKKALEIDKREAAFDLIANDLILLAHSASAMDQHVEAADYARRAMEIWALIQNTPKLEENESFFMELAEKGELEPVITKHLMQSWQKGRAVAAPCN